MIDNRFIETHKDVDHVSTNATFVFPEVDMVLDTMTQYEEWVKAWRETHTELMAAIQFFKREKNRLRDIGFYNRAKESWNSAVKLGKLATKMYYYRDFNKTQYHGFQYREDREYMLKDRTWNY